MWQPQQRLHLGRISESPSSSHPLTVLHGARPWTVSHICTTIPAMPSSRLLASFPLKNETCWQTGSTSSDPALLIMNNGHRHLRHLALIHRALKNQQPTLRTVPMSLSLHHRLPLGLGASRLLFSQETVSLHTTLIPRRSAGMTSLAQVCVDRHDCPRAGWILVI